MVTSPHALASQAGVGILQLGGSAVDAAIAAAAVLSVVYPHMTSVGGDAFFVLSRWVGKHLGEREYLWERGLQSHERRRGAGASPAS